MVKQWMTETIVRSGVTKVIASERMLWEVDKMMFQFPIGENKGTEAMSHWDVPFNIYTHSRKLVHERVDRPYWDIVITMQNLRKGKVNLDNKRFTLRATYTDNYPHEEPEVYSPSHKDEFRGAPHRLGVNRFCLTNHDGTRTGWDGSKSTAATMLLWGIHWIRTYYYWKETDVWPRDSE